MRKVLFNNLTSSGYFLCDANMLEESIQHLARCGYKVIKII